MYLIMNSDGQTFRNIAEAEAQTNIPHQNISSVLNGKRHSAGGMTWARVEIGDNHTIEDVTDKLIDKIQEQEAKATPQQQKAKAKAWEWRKHYQNAVENAQSIGLLFYHLPKNLGDHPTNKKIHQYNMEHNPAYEEYYNNAMDEADGNITNIIW